MRASLRNTRNHTRLHTAKTRPSVQTLLPQSLPPLEVFLDQRSRNPIPALSIVSVTKGLDRDKSPLPFPSRNLSESGIEQDGNDPCGYAVAPDRVTGGKPD